MNISLRVPPMKRALTAFLLFLSPLSLFAQSSSEDGFIDFSIGYEVMCGVRADNTTTCKTGPFNTNYDIPDNAPALAKVESGSSHSCGVTTGNGIYCWGDEDFGQLNAPNNVVNFVSVSVGTGFHSCGVTNDNQIICWGLDTNGQASPPNDGYGFTQVYVGYQSTCGLRLDAEIECWGGGDPDAPSRVFGYGPYKSFVTENGFSRRPDDCGLLVDGTFVCEDVSSPLLQDRYQDIAIVYPHVCGLQNDGEIECVREALFSSSENVELTNIEGRFTKMIRANSGVCALSVEGEIQCFGETYYSDLIPGSERTVPVPVGVAASIYSDTAIEITWERIRTTNRTGISGYEIFRNGEFQAVAEGNSFYDDTLVSGVDYSYSVRSISNNDTRSDFSEEILVNTDERNSGSPTNGTEYVVPNRPSEPLSVEVFVYSPNSVELIWNRPASNAAIGYEIRRNNNYIHFTRGVSFYDDSVSADNCYRYNILPVDSEGNILGLINAVAATGDVAGCN